MSAEVIPIRRGMVRATTTPAAEAAPISASQQVAELEIAAARTLAALYRLRDHGAAAAALDFGRLESIASVRELALKLNEAIDEALAPGGPR